MDWTRLPGSPLRHPNWVEAELLRPECRLDWNDSETDSIYENDLSNSVLINGQNFNSVDDDDGENDTMEFEPINQEVQHQLVYDLPLGLNDAINVTAKRRKTYPPICKHFLKKELRIRCRCMERLKVSVSSNSRIKGFPTQPTDDCNETKASLVSTMGEMLELMKDLPSSVEKAKGLEQLQLLELKTKPSKRRRQSSKPKPLIPKSLEEEVIVSEANNNTYHDNEGFLKVCNVLLGRSCFISSMSSTYLKEGCPSNLRKSGSPGDS
ncbi:uncharacterized protein LOC135484681 [Lineus longissimus]|uniref:uncharacterized protein LOC135484681 n=1 Tax=Lineus longissimus TaxID=88925 RepID=UPI002B4E9681